MNILIVAATAAEIAPFLQLPQHRREGVDVLVTGVGMVSTAFALGQRLAGSRYRLLLNVGIAGSFDPVIALGEVVNIYQDTFAELGAEDGDQFIDSIALGLAEHTFPGTPSSHHASLSGLRDCKGITVNTVHGHAKTIKQVLTRLNPATESMEGAAVCYAAHHAGIPVMQVRAISNYVERRNKANWRIPLAIENLNRWLVSFVDSYRR